MTAVEWLEKEIKEIISYIEEDGMYAMKGAEERLFGECNIFYKAKEMERQQIIEAHLNGQAEFDKGPYRSEIIKNSEQYYNETFKEE